MKDIACRGGDWHLDGTYKLLKMGKPLWIMSTKDSFGKVFPILFFMTPDETKGSIEMVLTSYKEWLGHHPQSIITDCQRSLQNAVKEVFDCQGYLCVFHILRAIRSNIKTKMKDISKDMLGVK